MTSIGTVLWLASALVSPASAEGCLDGQLVVEPQVVCPGDTVIVSGFLENCGEDRDLVTVTLQVNGTNLGAARAWLPAGASRSFQRSVVVPPLPPVSMTFTLSGSSKNGGTFVQNGSFQIQACARR